MIIDLKKSRNALALSNSPNSSSATSTNNEPPSEFNWYGDLYHTTLQLLQASSPTFDLDQQLQIFHEIDEKSGGTDKVSKKGLRERLYKYSLSLFLFRATATSLTISLLCKQPTKSYLVNSIMLLRSLNRVQGVSTALNVMDVS